MSITLDDVETAIKILELFIRKMRDAEIVLRKAMYYYRRTYGERYINPNRMSFEDFISLALQMDKAKKGYKPPEEEELEVTLTEEDKEKIRRIAEKLKETQ